VQEFLRDGTIVQKYFGVIKDYTDVFIAVHLVGLAEENKLIKIYRVSNSKIHIWCLLFISWGNTDLEETTHNHSVVKQKLAIWIKNTKLLT